MDIQIRKQACKHLKAAQFLVFMFFFPAAYAQFPMFPPAPYELYSPTTPDFIVGGYTVDWQDTT